MNLKLRGVYLSVCSFFTVHASKVTRRNETRFLVTYVRHAAGRVRMKYAFIYLLFSARTYRIVLRPFFPFFSVLTSFFIPDGELPPLSFRQLSSKGRIMRFVFSFKDSQIQNLFSKIPFVLCAKLFNLI